MKKIRVKYLSFGTTKTGGQIYEHIFSKILIDKLTNQGLDTAYQNIHFNRIYRGIHNFKLLFQSYKAANADIILTVARMALPAIKKSWFRRNKVLIFLHNYDTREYASLMLKFYYQMLFFALRITSGKKVGLVVVAPFWEDYFRNKFKNHQVFLFPNLYETNLYSFSHNLIKNKKIHLGQYSLKNDPDIIKLAEKLSKEGYECYFTSLNQADVIQTPFYSIKCTSFDQYLRDMAESCYTLALTRINEGWNRIAHESLLVGTPVIGYNKGGLGDLLKESGSYTVNDMEEAYKIITSKDFSTHKPDKDFIEKYDISKGIGYIQPVIDFVLNE
jgi:glycosyltransferase involved in cell wall biosynthesis